MPKTEAPNTPEQNEKPQKPSPETRVKKNEKSENKLNSFQKELLAAGRGLRKKAEKASEKVLNE